MIRKVVPLRIRIRPSSEVGLFHDSRSDVKRLAEVLNAVIDKQNEIIHALNQSVDANKGGGPQ
jgi:hypothetical protein